MCAPATVDLQIGLRHALILEAAFFQHPARGGVFRQARGFDPAEPHVMKGMMDHGGNRFAHVSLPGMGTANPVAQGTSLRRTATAEEKNLAHAAAVQRSAGVIGGRDSSPRFHT